MSILLDTSVVVDCLRARSSASAYVRRLATRPSISVVTVSEILAGVRRRREEEDATVFWSLVRPLDVDREIARRAGVFVRLYHSSHSVELADALIAATAEHHGLALATLNVKHFPMFPRLKMPY